MAAPRYAKNWDLPGLHEVVGYGRARPSPKFSSSQVQVEIFLAPVAGRDGYRFQPGVAPQCRWVGAGELGLYPIGSRWLDGSPKGVRLVDAKCRVSGRVARGTTMIALTDWDGGAGVATFPIPSTIGRCFVVSLDGGHFKRVAIPVVEVLRAFFGRTSELLMQLFCGRVPAGLRRFQVPERIESQLGEDVEIRFERRPSQPEALVAAMVLTDPLAKESFFNVNAGLITHRDWERGEGVPIETSFPFAAGVGLEVEGRWISRSSSDRPKRMFLATRILSISYTPSFKTLTARFPLTSRDGDAPPAEGSALIGHIETVLMNSSRDPAAGRIPLEIEVPGATVDLQGSVGFRLLPDDPASVSPPPSLLREEGQETAPGSTGDAVSGGDRGVRRVKVVDQDDFQGVDQSLQLITETDAAIRLLCGKRNWKEVCRTPFPWKIEGGLLVLLVCIEVNNVGIAICDGGKHRGRPRSVGIIRKKDGSLLTQADFGDLERLIAGHNAHWLRRPEQKQQDAWELGGILRERKKPDGKPATFVERLGSAIVRHAS